MFHQKYLTSLVCFVPKAKKINTRKILMNAIAGREGKKFNKGKRLVSVTILTLNTLLLKIFKLKKLDYNNSMNLATGNLSLR